MGNTAPKQDAWNIDDEFRESLATVDANGKRIWLYPRKPSGKFHNWRVAVTLVLLAMLFAGPFMRINGQPALLLNVFDRKFIILGQVFWPQDFFLLAFDSLSLDRVTRDGDSTTEWYFELSLVM